MRLAALGILVVLASSARAQPEPVLLPPQAVAPLPASPETTVTWKSPAVAGVLSIGVTLAGLGLVAGAGLIVTHDDDSRIAIGLAVTGEASFVLGPTTGHIYAGRAWNTGLKWRLISVGTFMGSLMIGTGCVECSGDHPVVVASIVGMGASVIGLAAATIYEMADAPGAARRANERRRRAREQGFQIGFTPAVSGGLGASAVGRF